jgi:hypothetical protein
MSGRTFQLEPGVEQRLAARLFNRVWELLEQPDRDAAQDEEMVHAAHASRHHWGQVGEPSLWVRGEWQCSRVYVSVGRAEPALYHARRALDLAQRHQLGPFYLGTAHEAIARAARLASLPDEAVRHATLARSAVDELADDDERQSLLADLATL